MANLRSCALSASLFLLTALPAAQSSSKEPPREWTDPDTGHRVVRLSDEPGSQSLYFHQNAYTPDGSKLIITTPTGLATIDLKTRAIDKVVEGRVTFTPDMRWIVFRSNMFGPTHVFAVEVNKP
jgi:oligogalacturonide lyase